MHFHTLLPITVALITASITNAKSGCATRYTRGHGVTTKTLAAKTSTVTVNVAPVATTTSIKTADTQTSITAELYTSTFTLIGTANTDIFTATSTNFAFVVPKTTITADIYTTTSTSVSTSLLPASTSTSTVYTALPADPTGLAAPTKRAMIDDDDVENFLSRRVSDAELLKRKQYHHRKMVYCTPVIDIYTTAVSGSASSTVTFTNTVFPTLISTRTMTAVVTSTYIPNDVTSVVTVTASSTLSADTLTFTTTPTQVASTVVPILITPTVAVTKELVSICDPAIVQKQAVSQVLLGQDVNQLVYTLPSQSDEESCCSAAASIAGAYGYAYFPYSAQAAGQSGGSCSAGYQNSTSYTSTTCGNAGVLYANFDTFTNDNIYSAGLLQCGSSFDITSGSFSPYNK